MACGLMQPPTEMQGFYTPGDPGNTQLTREEVLELLPPDLRPFMIIHNFDDDFHAYPALGVHDDPNADGFYDLWVRAPSFLHAQDVHNLL